MNYEFVVPCNFGVETFLAYELRRLKTDNVRSEDGRVFFSGSELDMARANICIATRERVLIHAGETEAQSCDML
ncbi:MAG: class I SAM-dependent RNA methyltransferase, partial [Oscillospiraceae bacterium]|nr:class I SAM-dependent RNA methyltransferase [Oscillospiraceae bacterium]